MTATAIPDLPALVKVITALQHRAVMLNAMIVASDGDEAGRRAAFRLADKAAALGWNVFTLAAPDGCDWNDVLMKRG